MEIWKDVIGFECLYQVSDLGRVKSVKRIVPVKTGTGRNKKGTQTVKEKILKPSIDRGYHRVTISYKGKTYRKNVHQFVAQVFIPNPNNKPHINHINGIHDDNRIENLEWCTPSENEKHSYNVLGKIPPEAKAAINIITGEKFTSITKAALSIGWKPGTVLAKLNGGNKTNNTPIRIL